MSEERHPWDRREREPTKLHAVFRTYRDLGPLRSWEQLEAHDDVELSQRTLMRHAKRWDWPARATAWDDHCAQLEDGARLEALREMHQTHGRAARALVQIALRGLRDLNPEEMTAADVARLLDLGSRLERETLTISVEELQGRPSHSGAADDPWEAIARELAPPA